MCPACLLAQGAETREAESEGPVRERFEPLPVDLLSFLASDVSFRETGGADGEIAGFTDKLYKL